MLCTNTVLELIAPKSYHERTIDVRFDEDYIYLKPKDSLPNSSTTQSTCIHRQGRQTLSCIFAAHYLYEDSFHRSMKFHFTEI